MKSIWDKRDNYNKRRFFNAYSHGYSQQKFQQDLPTPLQNLAAFLKKKFNGNLLFNFAVRSTFIEIIFTSSSRETVSLI